MNRRSLETYAVAPLGRPPAPERERVHAQHHRHGRLQSPRPEEGDPIYDALVRRGLRLPKHSTEMGSSIKKDLHYDQIAFFPPGASEQALVRASRCSTSTAPLFEDLWEARGRTTTSTTSATDISDHRLLWAEFAV